MLLPICLLTASAKAQSPPPNDLLSKAHSEVLIEVHGEVHSAVLREVSENNATAAAAPVTLPDTPAPQRVKVIDKKFIIVMGALGGAETLRFTTHKLVLDNEFAAGAPWVTSVPANPRLVAKYAAIYAAELLVAYELKKPHAWLPGDKVIRKLWWAYPTAMTAIHIKNGVRSIRTQAPSGCPPEECGSQ